MRSTIAPVAGSLALTWAIAYTAGSEFNQHHALLVLACVLMWCGLYGLVASKGVKE